MVASIAALLHCQATTLFVDLQNALPVPPYASWDTAATNIQDAIDAANPADLILVTNGIYQAGGRMVYGTLTNRVVVDKAITLQSVNGPAVTAIVGAQSPGATNGDGAVRCIFLVSGARLNGFTLTNGATSTTGIYDQEGTGGGVWCESQSAIVSNCIIVGNSAAAGGGGAHSGKLIDCLVKGNSSIGDVGGGALGSIVVDSQILENTTPISGGGAAYCTLTNCTLANNWADQEGGGAFSSQIFKSLIKNNSAGNDGGGISDCTGTSCQIISNSAGYYGGGTSYYFTVLNSCILVGNSAAYGGAADYGTLNNCTVVGNSATISGGGVISCPMSNCIVYYNTAPDGPNYLAGDYFAANNCCLIPLPGDGFGNITNAPLLVDLRTGDLHLRFGSPCINAGNNSYVTTTTDLDGNPRIEDGTVDIGAYEGPSLEYLVPCSGPLTGGRWKNHGQYVTQVVKVLLRLRREGIITCKQALSIFKQSAASNCGKGGHYAR